MWLQRSPHLTCKGMPFRGLSRFVPGLHTWGVLGAALSSSTETWANPQLSLATSSCVCPTCLPTRPVPPAFHTGFISSLLPDVPGPLSQRTGGLRWSSCPGLSGAFNDIISPLMKGIGGQETRGGEEGGGEERRDERERREWRETTP